MKYIDSNRITYNSGFSELKDKIIEIKKREKNITVESDEVIITHGASGGIFSIFKTLINKGDEIIVPDPCWPQIIQIIKICGGVPVFYPFLSSEDKKELVNNLSSIITLKTKIVFINSPHNPTGLTLSEKNIKDLACFLKNENLFIVTDDTYEKLIFDDKNFSTLLVENDIRSNVISVNSFSKSYNMTGWRIGFIIADKSVAKEIKKVNNLFLGGINPISQFSALQALSEPPEYMSKRIKCYEDKRNKVLDILDKYNIEYVYPEGTFYVFINTSVYISDVFIKNLLCEHNISVLPGSLFGKKTGCYIRVALVKDIDILKKGIEKIAIIIKDLS